MNPICGCCEGVERLTPMPTANRPGLAALSYRVGTHATFLETMKARLSNLYLETPQNGSDQPGKSTPSKLYPLRSLRTRDPADPAIALMDSWAMIADVLTFYQERIANEGYLRTALERRSILELARLVGYALRPGVASTAYLAYNIEEDRSVTPPRSIEAIIPAGSRVQSVPGPGELPQFFETSEPLKARTEWNKLKPRMAQPQTPESIPAKGLYLKGISLNLKANDALLIDFDGTGPYPFRAGKVKPDPEADRTLVTLLPWATAQTSVELIGKVARRFSALADFDVAPTSAMAKKIVNSLTELERMADSGVEAPKVKEFLESNTLPALAEEHTVARASHFAKLEPWLEQMIGALGEARRDLVQAIGLHDTRGNGAGKIANIGLILKELQTRASVPPASAARLGRSINEVFTARADIYPRLMVTLNPALQPVLYPALRNAKVTPDSGIKVYALRVTASLFGHNAPRKPTQLNEATKVMATDEWSRDDIVRSEGLPQNGKGETAVVFLAASHDQILPGSWVVVDASAAVSATSFEPASPGPIVARVKSAQAALSRAEYGITGPSTRVALDKAWLRYDQSKGTEDPIHVTAQKKANDFEIIRRTVVYAESEELALADEPVTDPICDGMGEPIELDRLYDGLEAGRWLIISGERSDIPDTSGVRAAERVMLAGVRHGTKQIKRGEVLSNLRGDQTHTFLTLSDPLAYCYKRDTVTIYGNVVKATHGETRKETLGNGEASKPLQKFALRQPPLTFLPAVTPAGAASTLSVRVNEIEWHETDTLAALGPTDRNFVTQTDDDGKTRVIFGNGHAGARPATGLENIQAVYRNGIGKAGNVKAEQISLLVTRPLGVKDVINPLRASGGANPEARDQARGNAPLAVRALGRLVSVEDYADFARTFAGIGKASAVRLSDGSRLLVHVTIAGADDIPIDPDTDLYRSLLAALREFGDPLAPVEIQMRELLLLIISAKVAVAPDYQWETVEPKVRAALLQAFGFERRELGQDVTPAEVISVIQSVPGVAYVDLDFLQAANQEFVERHLNPPADDITRRFSIEIDSTRPRPIVPRAAVGRVVAELGRPNPEAAPGKSGPRILPAQLAILSPDVPDTILLNQVTQ